VAVILNKTITTREASAAVDAQGVAQENFAGGTDLDTAVPCAIQQMSQRETQAFERRGVDVDFIIFTRTRLTAALDDIATDGGGTIYVLKDVNQDEGGRGRVFSHTAKKMRGV
jgi:hypothetical protein